MSDIERENLDAHVSLCELRYLALERRLTAVEDQLQSVQTLLLQIRDTLSQLPAQQAVVANQRWERLQWAVIGVLLSVCAWAVNQVWP